MIRLIDPKKPVKRTIEGVDFYIRQLTNGEKMKLSKRLQELNEDESDYDALLLDIAQFIDKIDGLDGEPGDILIRISDVKIQGAIINAVLDVSSLSDDESKNSQPLSDGQ